ncbi:MAG: YIP1 family protein [Euryarchaeota archaeon]|nr:YIP1 family protein [Euryarchaeota archaeon]
MSTGTQLKTAFTSPPRLFQQLKKKSLREDLQFFFGIVIAVSICFTLGSFLLEPYPGNESGISELYFIGLILLGTLIGLLQGLINGVISLLGISLIEHFFLLFVNEHQGFEKTMKSVIYALLPCILFFWVVVIVNIPFVSLLLLFCFGLITYCGIRVFHEKSKDRAAFVSLATSAVLLMLFHRWIFSHGLSF